VLISLNNTEGRKLWNDDPMRFDFFMDYKTEAKEINFTKQYPKEELITKPKDLALEVIIHMYERFGWEEKASADIIKKDQDNLLNRRF